MMVAVRRVYDAAEVLGPTRYAGGMRQAVLPAPGWAELRASIIAMGHAAGYDVPEESWSPSDDEGCDDG